MFHWFCPFSLSPAVTGFLSEINGIEWDGVTPPSSNNPVVLILLAPHQLIGSPDAILPGYQRLASLSEYGPILQIDRFDQRDWANLFTIPDYDPALLASNPILPVPDALLALVTRALLESIPDIADAYQDLQLTALVPGCEPDVDYVGRLSILAAAAEVATQYCALSALPASVSQLSALCLDFESQLLQRDSDLDRVRAHSDQLARLIEIEKRRSDEIQARLVATGSAFKSLLYDTQLELEDSYVKLKRSEVIQEDSARALCAANSTLYDTQQELEESYIRLKSSEAEKAGLTSALAVSSSSLDDAQQELSHSLSEIRKLTSTIDALNSDLASVQSLAANLRSFESAFNESQRLLDDTQRQLSELQLLYDSEMSLRERILSTLRGEIFSLQQDLLATQKELEDHHIENRNMKSVAKTLESELEEAYQNIKVTQEVVESCLLRESSKDQLIHDQHLQLRRVVALLGAAVNAPSAQGAKKMRSTHLRPLNGNDVQVHSLLCAYQACLQRAHHLMKLAAR